MCQFEKKIHKVILSMFSRIVLGKRQDCASSASFKFSKHNFSLSVKIKFNL